MLGTLSSLKSILKFKKVKIDATIFRLSYKFSVAFMIASSILVTLKQYFGDPIDCVHTHDLPSNMLNTYCWIHTTYTIPSAFWKRISVDVPHPGIDKTVDPDERRYIKYYQWVVFCLSFQAILFYLPRWLWKNWEGGKIGSLKMGLDMGIISENDRKNKKKLLIDYLSSNLRTHNLWAYKYLFCELLALINIFGQIFLMDLFFDGTFLTYGIEVMSFAERDQEDRIDPMVFIFPRMTKCTFHKFGASGQIEKHDAMCILPLNVINEKIYIFLWFWMLLLSGLSVMVLIYRLFIIISPRMRAYLLYIRFRLVKKDCINIIIKKTKIGDWFLLYMLGQNIDSVIYKEVIHELAQKLGYHNKDIYDS